MRQPLSRQIFLPFAYLVVAVTVGVSAITAMLGARGRQAEALERLTRVVETLQTSQFPFTEPVLKQMNGLSGAEFVVRDASGVIGASTLSGVPADWGEAPFSKNDAMARLTVGPTMRVDGQDFFAAELPLSQGPRPGSLVVLLPVEAWRRLGWEAAWPPLAAGAFASLSVLIIARSLAGRLTRRLEVIRSRMLKIANRSADHLDLDGPDDELRHLASAVNTVADQLRQHERTVQQTERMRLVAQLSSGLAHQLRNAASGARLAVQLVRRRHPQVAEQELGVALTQLELMEDHIKRLLAVGPERQTPPRPGTVEQLFGSVEELAAPVARHAGVEVSFNAKALDAVVLPDLEPVRSAVLNLVMNGMDAAGNGGQVCIEADKCRPGELRLTVSDSGPGPAPDIAERIFEPFVTSKPEGVGLGLAFVRRTIEQLGGTVSWRRDHELTRFLVMIPTTEVALAGAGRPAQEEAEQRGRPLEEHRLNR